MASGCAAGDLVQTPLGKGLVRERRGGGRLVVEIGGRKVVVDERHVRPIVSAKTSSKSRGGPGPSGERHFVRDVPDVHAPVEVDLHGLTVADALARAESAINESLLADRAQIRFIHGRSGGRIRAALHRQLRLWPSVRGFRLDPGNEGVTIVEF